MGVEHPRLAYTLAGPFAGSRHWCAPFDGHPPLPYRAGVMPRCSHGYRLVVAPALVRVLFEGGDDTLVVDLSPGNAEALGRKLLASAGVAAEMAELRGTGRVGEVAVA